MVVSTISDCMSSTSQPGRICKDTAGRHHKVTSLFIQLELARQPAIRLRNSQLIQKAKTEQSAT